MRWIVFGKSQLKKTKLLVGYGTVSKASPDTMFVALEDFRRKVILFEPPDCKARDEARVLQCWTKGRI